MRKNDWSSMDSSNRYIHLHQGPFGGWPYANEADEMYQASRCLMWWLNRWLTFIRIEKVKKRSRYLFENRELPPWCSSRMKCLLESLVEALMGTFGLEFRDESPSRPTWEPWELRLCLWRTFREDEHQGQSCVVSVVRKIDRSIMKNQAGGSQQLRRAPLRKGVLAQPWILWGTQVRRWIKRVHCICQLEDY